MEEKKTGQRLREFRRELKLNQSDFAKLLQVTQSSIARWERGEKSPSDHYKTKIEQLLELSEYSEIMEAIQKTLTSKGGLPATAGLLGMLFGFFSAYGAGISHVLPIIRDNKHLLYGVDKLTQKIEETNYNKRRD